MIPPRLAGLLGLAVIIGAAWFFSARRSAVRLNIILWGLGLQFAFAVLVLRTGFGGVFQWVSRAFAALLNYALSGSGFVFGAQLGTPSGPFGVIFAFQVLSVIVFVASLLSILYYLDVMPQIVRLLAACMRRTMRISGAESLDVAASIVMGMTEAPLTIRPFLATLTQSELFTVMTCGMAHVSGSTMAAYVLVAHVEIKHLLTAVIMTAPATILLAKLFVPETETPSTAGDVPITTERNAVNVIDAAARGAGDGLSLALNVAAMLIAFIALIALLNGLLGWVHSFAALGWIPANMQGILGPLFSPVAWLLGVPWKDAPEVGNLLAVRMILNEFVAFTQLGTLQAQLDPRSFTIATYALCGFANLSSIAIMIGGIGALAPTRKSDLARLGFRAMLAGTMANFMSACIAGLLL